MNLNKLKDPFPADEIEWRIGQCGKKGNGQIWATCLAYVTGRAIMDRLDDVCEPHGWMVAYRFIEGSNGTHAGVIAQISILVGDQWVMKEDGAEQTDIESFKGGLSSALKRAGSAWGIGRYLYSLESGFAQIVDRQVPGARWGKTKDGAEFHWSPPSLPAWALPVTAGADSRPKIKPANFEDSRPVSGIGGQQPPLSDGVTPDYYTVTFGQWKKRTIDSLLNDPKIGPKGLSDYVVYLEDPKQVAGRKPEMVELVNDFIERAVDAITALERDIE